MLSYVSSALYKAVPLYCFGLFLTYLHPTFCFFRQADLHSNKFDGQFPHGNSTQLHYLDVHDNEISMLPGSIGKHANLAYLDLSKNTFEELPAEVAQLTKLEYLFLAENEKLEPGSIPEWLNDLPRLSAVSFKDTNRIGELPHWLWRLDQLTMLDLEGNNINGTILRQLHKMTSLEYLFLNRNELSGNVPDTLGNMTSLKLLNVDHNKLTGQIEDTICAMDLEVLVADCLVSETRTQPQIECACCTKCCDPDIDQCNTRDWSKDYGENSWGGYYIRYNILDEGDVYKQVQINAEKNGSD